MGSKAKSKKLTDVHPLNNQNFAEIRDKCVKSGKLFEDDTFSADDATIFPSGSPKKFEWKRPHEICKDPHMFVGGASRFDVKQGELGNCWFLAAVASLCAAKDQQLLNRVVCPDNSFSKNYGGVVHFRLFRFGKWMDVVLDDKLPTYNGQLCFMHSADPNEFWSALIEKAYAKVMGSYEILVGGNSSEAMVDFTGGVCESFSFAKGVPDDTFVTMDKALMKSSLMGCSIDAHPSQIESVLPNGLIIGHAYSITAVKELKIQGKKEQLVRVRNPWGNQYEWKGAWSDGAAEWKNVSAKNQKDMGVTATDDGEFWMSFKDFTSNYKKMEICYLGPASFTAEAGGKKKWEANSEDGLWKPRVNAGGCRNFLDTFWTNPQFRVEVVDADDNDDENLGTLIVSILQKERRKKRLKLLTMGYMIYKIEDPSATGPLEMDYFKYNAAVAKSPAFSNMREVAGRHRLAPGKYAIIPCTFQPQEEGDFLLRFFSERENIAEEMDEETKIVDDHDAKKGDKQRVVTKEDVNAQKEVQQLFKEVSGEDLEVDAAELKSILDKTFLKTFKFDGFSTETCRSMVAMMDADRSGKLGYDEFRTLWTDLRDWSKVFLEFDKDKSGTFNSFELRQALNASGFRVSNATFNNLVMRYSDAAGNVFFDDYILCAVRMKNMFDIYKKHSNGGKEAKFGLDDFIQTTIYS